MAQAASGSDPIPAPLLPGPIHFRARKIVNAAGLYGDLIASMLFDPLPVAYRQHWCKGQYWAYTRKPTTIKRLVYPLPEADLKVRATADVAGNARHACARAHARSRSYYLLMAFLLYLSLTFFLFCSDALRASLQSFLYLRVYFRRLLYSLHLTDRVLECIL